MNTLLQQFVVEARDYLESAAQALLGLETSRHDYEAVNGIFRSFHTLKGMEGRAEPSV